MSITLEQAKNLKVGDELHIDGKCTRTTGPRGGVTETTVRVRVSGRPQTRKTRPAEVRVPYKYGLYDNGAITEHTLYRFHTKADCPLNDEPGDATPHERTRARQTGATVRQLRAETEQAYAEETHVGFDDDPLFEAGRQRRHYCIGAGCVYCLMRAKL